MAYKITELETFLDVLLIEELPEKDALKTGVDGIIRTEKTATESRYGKVIACDTKFPYAGVWIDMPYKPGDIVKTKEYGRRKITMSAADEKPGATKYYLIRYPDVEGRVQKAPDVAPMS